MKNKIVCLIPAAGKGTRSGLDYPKCLYKINSTPILIRIIKNIQEIDSKPTIVIQKKFLELFLKNIKSYNFKVEILFQHKPLGMGNAILQFNKSKKISNCDILLIWGDIPYIRKSTIKKLIKFHFKKNNDLTLITKHVKNPYTVVKRDLKNKIISVNETKINKKFITKYGEREIGIFLFKKNIIFNYLKKNLSNKYNNGEHGFLYVIEHLIKDGYKVDALPIANNREIISFNSINDLK